MDNQNNGHGFTREEIAYGAFCIYEEEKRRGQYSGQDAHWFEAIDRLTEIRARAQEIEKCRNRGSAAKLLGPQKLLYIFVNDDGAGDWTKDMREPVEIKIGQSTRWLEEEAKKRELNLTIEHRCLPLSPAIACSAGRHINQADYVAGPENATWMNVVASGLTRYGQLSECWDRLFQLAGLPLTGDEGR
jgi:hypothetical protein